MSSYAAAPIQGHFRPIADISLPGGWPDAVCVDYRSLGKGVRWAIGIEAGAALIIYGIWQICHLWL